MDELAYALKLDPLELRLRNYADSGSRRAASRSRARSLRECYRAAAERFGWSRRPSATSAMRKGNALVGWGMATATYPAHRMRGVGARARCSPTARSSCRRGRRTSAPALTR